MATSMPMSDIIEPSGIDLLDFLPFGGSFDLPSTSASPYAIPDRRPYDDLEGLPQIGDAEAGPSGRFINEVSTPMLAVCWTNRADAPFCMSLDALIG